MTTFRRHAPLMSDLLTGAAVLGTVAMVMLSAHRPAALAPSPVPAVTASYPRPPIAETIIGHVAQLSDGDSFFLAAAPGACGSSARTAIRTGALGCRQIRLTGIDAPELSQTCTLDGQQVSCGEAAKAQLERLIAGAEVTCETPADDPRDRYGRAIAFCRTAAVIDLNIEMVRLGHAVLLRQFLRQRPHAAAFIAAEAEAYATRRGIWAGEFQAPADYRAARRAGN